VTNESQQAKANALRELHKGPALVLPNAWDAGSAALVVRAGAKAVATTSGGVSWTQARPDGQQLTRAEMADLVGRIVRAVEVPVTADVEAGYGPTSDDVAATVSAVIDAGAVGVNLEDSTAPGGPLFSVAEQAERLRAARAAGDQAGLPAFVVNARTDVYLFQVGAPEGRFDDVVTRAVSYAEAGADCLFVPGLVDLDVLKALVAASPLPVNAMTGAGGPEVADLEAVGVQRISVGTGLTQAAYSATLRAATELLTRGTLTELATALDFGGIDSVFRREGEHLP
jgi:2-methylisocitrate lyase-like PEP mutase family enzyme